MAVSALLGCAAPAPCYEPRDPTVESCVAVTQSFRFNPSLAWDEYEQFCSAACLDVDGFVGVTGYSALEEVPLLRKMRNVKDMYVDVHRLRNLRGLELIDVTVLEVAGKGVDDALESLEGLSDRSFQALGLSDISGSGFMRGMSIDAALALSVDASGVESLDLQSVQVGQLLIRENRALTRIDFPNSEISALNVSGNDVLRHLGWDAGTRLRQSRFEVNAALSSCEIEAFVAATRLDAGIHTSRFNAPCP